MYEEDKEDDIKLKPGGVDEIRLQSIVAQQIQLAKDYGRRTHDSQREKALDYYFGNLDKYIPPETNRSKAVSRDFSDTVGWILPGVMRVFTASDKMAEAEPVGMEDIKFAKQATDGINYVFWKENKGYEIVYNATWDSLVFGNGIVKTYYDDTEKWETSFHSDLTDDQLALLLKRDDEGEEPKVLAHSVEVEQMQDEMGNIVQIEKHDVKIKRKKTSGAFVIEVIPPEEFLKDQDSVSLDDAAFMAHWKRVTRSELVQMGYDKAVVAEIPEAAQNQTAEEISRQDKTQDEYADASMQLVDYYECFIRIDADNDGEAELIRACFAGSENGKLLDWEAWEDDSPFDDIPCDPVPHRWEARSVGDETMDVVDIKTVLLRQSLNNLYATNQPQRFVKGKISNPDELFNPTFGGVVFGDSNAEVTPLEVPFVANHAFEAMAYQDEVIQKRTGVGRSTMALDPETLQNQTATANQNQRDASYSQIELIARNQAEFGWRRVFRKLMRLMIKHQDGPKRIMVQGQPMDIDPRFWNADMDVTINVGLGTGSRDRDAQMLGQVLQQQIAYTDRIAALDPAAAIEMLPYIHNTLTRFTEAVGLKNPEAYWPEASRENLDKLMKSLSERQQQPDPKVAADMAKAKADMDLQAAKLQQEAQIKSAQIQSDAALKREQMDAEMQLKREQMGAEFQLKREQMAMEAQLKAGQIMTEAQTKREISSDVRFGGETG